MGLLNALKMQIDSFWKVGHVILKPSQIKRSNHGEICGIGITDVCSCLLITIVMMPFNYSRLQRMKLSSELLRRL